VGLKVDRFTWIVIGIVAALLIAAIVSVNLTGDREPPAYLENDTPAAPVYNAFLALQQGDVTKARSYYNDDAFAESEGVPSFPPLESYPSGTARRLRITDVQVDESNPDRALVTFTLDTYWNAGPFGSGSIDSYERTVEVVKEDGVWKLNSYELFY
jgi:hypothetical protein